MNYEPFTKKVEVKYNDVMSGAFFCPCCHVIVEVEKLKMPDFKSNIVPNFGRDRVLEESFESWGKP